MQNLEQYAEILTGYHFRGSAEFDPDGKIPIFQIKDMPAGGTLDSKPNSRIGKLPSENYLSRTGDILIQSRGTQVANALITDEAAGVLVTSAFIIIRPEPAELDPAYFAWYLQQRPAQEYLEKIRTGSTMVRVIMPKDLREMPVPLPPLSTQIAIGQIYVLGVLEKKLTEQIASLKLQLTHQQLRNALRKWKDKKWQP